jgi:hypothetical protein
MKRKEIEVRPRIFTTLSIQEGRIAVEDRRVSETMSQVKD